MIQPPIPYEGGSLLEWAKSIWKYIRAIRPIAGAGLTSRETSNGTIFSVLGATGRSTIAEHPLAASFTPADGETSATIALTAGTYQIGVTGEYVPLPATAAQDGSYAYAVINNAEKTVEIVVSKESKPDVEWYDEANNPPALYSNVLLAEIVETEGEPALVQRQHGNLLIVLCAVDGKPALWAFTVDGSVPATT
jgi:hypothetical protein